MAADASGVGTALAVKGCLYGVLAALILCYFSVPLSRTGLAERLDGGMRERLGPLLVGDIGRTGITSCAKAEIYSSNLDC